MSYILGDRATLEKLAAMVDADMGYPKSGSNRGTGRHVSAIVGRTMKHAEPVQNKKTLEWFYQVDKDSSGSVTKIVGDISAKPVKTADETAIAALPAAKDTTFPTYDPVKNTWEDAVAPKVGK